MMKWSDKNRDMAGTQAAMLRATRKAIQEAKLRGELVPQWRDGKVVWVRPEEVELPPAPEDQATPSSR
ncbi:MAG: hypothetical protein GX616_17035 [Planctomycetes bacterium]|jgi:hypothetical protein|nr:hypothetical protein [Planctomycetota bacterium]